jgi:hypothetical protein
MKHTWNYDGGSMGWRLPNLKTGVKSSICCKATIFTFDALKSSYHFSTRSLIITGAPPIYSVQKEMNVHIPNGIRILDYSIAVVSLYCLDTWSNELHTHVVSERLGGTDRPREERVGSGHSCIPSSSVTATRKDCLFGVREQCSLSASFQSLTII